MGLVSRSSVQFRGAEFASILFHVAMSGAIAGLLGAMIGGAAAIAGAIVQARATAKTAEKQRAAEVLRAVHERERTDAERRQALARRYLFGLQDSTESLRRRLENWARRGGRSVAESKDPGYWEITTLYAVARALAAERVLALEAVYPALAIDFPGLAAFFEDHSVDRALEDALGSKLLRYHRLALAEAALVRDADEFRVLIYSEFRRRYEDPKWGLQAVLEPATSALSSLSRQEMEKLERALDEIVEPLEFVTRMPWSDRVPTA